LVDLPRAGDNVDVEVPARPISIPICCRQDSALFELESALGAEIVAPADHVAAASEEERIEGTAAEEEEHLRGMAARTEDDEEARGGVAGFSAGWSGVGSGEDVEKSELEKGLFRGLEKAHLGWALLTKAVVRRSIRAVTSHIVGLLNERVGSIELGCFELMQHNVRESRDYPFGLGQRGHCKIKW
jgi:hypothetical protein